MNISDESARLRRAFDRLPKSGSHGSAVTSRHPDVRPEWIISIIEESYDEWTETHERSGQSRTIIVGRVPQFEQWIKVVFNGVGNTRELLTAYPDRRLSKRYGGRLMAEPISVPQNIDALSEATVKYWAADQVLEIHNGKALGDGEEIAQFITVFYDRECENEVVAVRLDFAESVLKPFVDAILAKYSVSVDAAQNHKQAKVKARVEAAEDN